MQPTEAMQLISQVIAQYRGNRQEHALLQQAEQTLLELIKPVENNVKKDDKKETK